MKTKKIAYFEKGYNVAPLEDRLDDEAVSGWHLSRKGFFHLVLTEGRTALVKHRVVFDAKAREAHLAAGYRELEQIKGKWVMVGDRHLPEPDRMSAEEMEKKKASLKHQVWLVSGLTFFMVFFFGWMLFSGSRPLTRLVEGNFLSYPFLVLLQLGSLYDLIKQRRALAGGFSGHAHGWRYHTAVLLLGVLAIGIPLSDLMGVSERRPMTEGFRWIEDTEEGVDTYERFSVMEEANLLAYIEEQEERAVDEDRMWPDGSGAYSPSHHRQIYRLRLPFLAEPLAEELGENVTLGRYKPGKTYRNESGYYIYEDEYWRELVAAGDGKVFAFRYHGLLSTEEVIELFEAWMAAEGQDPA